MKARCDAVFTSPGFGNKRPAEWFASHAQRDIPKLLVTIEELRGEVERLKRLKDAMQRVVEVRTGELQAMAEDFPDYRNGTMQHHG